ncbi:MAG TPA: 30S ribosomal protein S18 [Anaerolineales bacterium]|nr:30S ribosomal protein S18 [Anaerolineales bacterium]
MDNERRRSEEEGTEEEFEGRGRTLIRRVHVCQFCVDKNKKIDYKNVEMLRSLVSDRGKIRPRRQTGTCARHQRQVATAIKRARHMALLPFSGEMPRY